MMPSKFDPPRRELWFRLYVGIGGLCLLAVALWLHGIPTGPAFVEVVGLSGIFFGGTVVWSAWKLWHGRAG
jgi:xanthosine utilization system XapX-like protein